jgi:trigger factor
LTFKDGDTVLSSADSETIRIRSALSFRDAVIKDFDKLMEGVQAGDTKTTQVTIAKDAPNPEYSGKTVEAVFEIIAVRKMVLPTLSKDFMERLGGFEDEGDFRDAVLDTLQRQLEHRQQQQIRQQITELLTVSASWELPKGLLQRQSEREYRRTVMELQRSGFGNEEIIAQANFIRQNSAAETARALKEHFILEKIAETEKIEETEADYETEIALISAQSNVSPRRVRAKLEKDGDLDILRNQIVERKVIELIAQSATFKEVPFEMDAADEEGVDFAVSGETINEASEEDLKAVHQEINEKQKFDANYKVK